VHEDRRGTFADAPSRHSSVRRFDHCWFETCQPIGALRRTEASWLDNPITDRLDHLVETRIRHN
jgi:hypothetical protein